MDEEFSEHFIEDSVGGGFNHPKRGFNSKGRFGDRQQFSSSSTHNRFSRPMSAGKAFAHKKKTASNKRNVQPRFDKQSTTQPVAHIKSAEPKSTGIQMYAARRTFQINVGNTGVDLLSQVTFSTIAARDHRMAANMTANQLSYVLTMAYANRIVQTAIKAGYMLDIPAASELKRAAGAIQLPGLLVKYIETMGTYKMASGATVAPAAGGYDFLFPPDNQQQLSPAQILQRAGRPIPNNLWRIDYDWIQSWNEATTRPSRLGMTFSSVESSEYEGKAEMLVSFRDMQDLDDEGAPLTFQGVSPQGMSEAEGMLGACYQFRNNTDQVHWLPGNRQLLFAAFLTTEFQPKQYLSDLVVASFTAVK